MDIHRLCYKSRRDIIKRLLKYANGDEYIIGGGANITPNGVEPIEEYDLTPLTN